jgi:hypothetical protein
MRHLLLFFLAALWSPENGILRAQDPSPLPYGLEDETNAHASIDRWTTGMVDGSDIPRDLWYGTPGVRVGEDLLGPIMDLVRRPSSLLDFTPRKVKSYLTDRETLEFLRERR